MASFMMRNDINIAIVSMVRENSTANNTLIASNNSVNTVPIGVTFDWSSGVQSFIMGSFYACYVLSQVSYGIFEVCNLSICFCCNN